MTKFKVGDIVIVGKSPPTIKGTIVKTNEDGVHAILREGIDNPACIWRDNELELATITNWKKELE